MMVIDTSAVVAILNREPQAERLVRCALESRGMLMSRGTVVELGIVVQTKWGAGGDSLKVTLLNRLRIEAVDVDAEQARLAIEAYSRFGRGTGSRARLNFGDCFAYACARHFSLPLLYKGEDFARTDIAAA